MLSVSSICDFAFCLPAEVGIDHITGITDRVSRLGTSTLIHGKYMDWFKPAWEQLSDDDRYCLETFYVDGNTYGSSAAYYIAEYLHVEQPTAYKRKNRALDRLTVLLFGKS